MLRTMDTQALAAAFPLASADLPAPLPGRAATGGGVLYGVNPDSQGIVWWDRWACENHNSVVLARSGAGKSYMVKLDVLRNLYQGVHVAVIDPEDEYLRLGDSVGGTIVRLGAPGVRLNPLDLPVGDRRPDVLTAGPCSCTPSPRSWRGSSRHRPNAPPWTGPSSPSTGRPASPRTRPPTTGPHRCCVTWPPSWPTTVTMPAGSWRPGCTRGSPDRSPTCSTAPPPPGPTATWSSGRCGTCPTNCVASARCWPWTRSGVASTPRDANTPGGWSWWTRHGCSCATARAPGSCSAWPRRPANATPA